MAIGAIHGQDWTAVLEDNQTWSSENEHMKERLERDFPRERYDGPAFGVPGWAQLHAAGEALGAHVIKYRPAPETVEGAVY